MKKHWNTPELKVSGVEDTKLFDWITVKCPLSKDGWTCRTCHPGHFCHIYFQDCPVESDPGGSGGGDEDPS